MIGLFCFVLTVLASPFNAKLRFEAERGASTSIDRLEAQAHGRVPLTNHDRWFFIQLYHWFPAILKGLTITRPETLVRWHRAGFRCYWRWKSRFAACCYGRTKRTMPLSATSFWRGCFW